MQSNKLAKDIKSNLLLKWRKLTYIFRKPYYRYRLFKRFKKHPYYGAWDMTEYMLYIPFEMFCEFYEKGEMWKICYDESPWRESKEEMDVLYKWYKEVKPRKENEEAVLLDTWSEHHTFSVEPADNDTYRYHSRTTVYGRHLSELLNQHESSFEKEKEEMLVRLMKVRRCLWT